MDEVILLDGRRIGATEPPYIVAEMSGNHNQSLDRAFRLIEAAAASGVNALKIQTYTADTMTLDLTDGEFFIDDPSSLWNKVSLHQLYQQAYTPWEWHAAIFERCAELGITCFSTPFDLTAVEFLEKLGAPAYKIASFENTDLRLIRRVAATGKPLIISTGMATLAELDETVRAARQAGCKDLILLKCTSTYPATADNSNVRTIPHLREAFGCQVGLSDHTLGLGVAVAAVALGTTFIEKHFTLDRSEGGVDSAFSMEPAEMKALVSETRQAWRSLGQVTYGTIESEMASRRYRRSLYVSQDVEAGEVFSELNVRAIRPGFGLPVKYLDIVMGKMARTAIKKGAPLTWDLIG